MLLPQELISNQNLETTNPMEEISAHLSEISALSGGRNSHQKSSSVHISTVYSFQDIDTQTGIFIHRMKLDILIWLSNLNIEFSDFTGNDLLF